MNWIYMKIYKLKEIYKGSKRAQRKSVMSRIKDKRKEFLKWINKRNPNKSSCMVLYNVSSNTEKAETFNKQVFL